MDLGQKHACSDCGSLFFDLNKLPPVCPTCGEEVRLTPPRTMAPAPKAEIPSDEVVEDPVDETKQEDDEFDEDPDSVTLGSSQKPVMDEEALDDD